ncbi:MAG: O-antigen ligase family protein [Clostridium sp.]
MNIKKIRECKTLEEFFQVIPEQIFQKLALLLMIYWSISPIIVAVTSWITGENLGIELSSIVYEIGNLGLIIGFFLAIKSLTSSREKNIKLFIKENKHNLLLTLMLLGSFISALNAKNSCFAFYGDNYRREGFFRYISYAGFYICALNLGNEKYKKIVFYTLSTVGTILAFLTILQFYEVNVSAFSMNMKYASIFHNTNHFGYYLSIIALVAAVLSIVEEKKYLSLIFLAEFAIMLTALIINNTFGSYLGVLGGIIFIIGIFFMSRGKIIKEGFIPLIIFIVISLFMNSGYVNGSGNGNVCENFSSLKNDAESIVTGSKDSGKAGSSRWILWVNALDFIKEKPLIGYGPDNLSKEYNSVDINQSRPHNEYIQHAACLGIFSLLCYMGAICIIGLNIFNKRKTLKLSTIISICAVASYLISALFGNTMYYTTPYFFIVLGIASKVD